MPFLAEFLSSYLWGKALDCLRRKLPVKKFLKSIRKRFFQSQKPIQLGISTSGWVLQVLDGMGQWEERCPIDLVGIRGHNVFVIAKKMPKKAVLEFIDGSYKRTFRIIPLVPAKQKFCATFDGMEYCPCIGVIAISRDGPLSKKLRCNIEGIRREILRRRPEMAEYVVGNSDVWMEEMVLRKSIYNADSRKRRRELKKAQNFREKLQHEGPKK